MTVVRLTIPNEFSMKMLTTILIGTCVLSALLSCSKTPSSSSSGSVSPPASSAEARRICANTPISQGWILVNKHRVIGGDCGNPPPDIYNVWEIERYDDKPINSTMTACIVQVPTNWVRIDTYFDPVRCGYRPGSGTAHNVMRIQRVR